MAAMPNKVLLGGSNGLGGEVVAVHAPIYSKGPNVCGGETPRVRLPAGRKWLWMRDCVARPLTWQPTASAAFA